MVLGSRRLGDLSVGLDGPREARSNLGCRSLTVVPATFRNDHPAIVSTLATTVYSWHRGLDRARREGADG